MPTPEIVPAVLAAATLRGLVPEVRRALQRADISEAPLEAEVLVRHVLGLTPVALLACPDRTVTDEERRTLQALLDRRSAREPLAYITGTREFHGLAFRVDRAVLVPRPETETLVEEALRWAAASGRVNGPLAVADVGTGSGCVAVSLAVRAPQLAIVATDISAAALAVARENAQANGVAHRVQLVQCDLLAAVSGPLDLVVANLPYVPDAEVAGLQPEVALFEPPVALRGGPDGTEAQRRLLASLPGRLAAGGSVMLEISPPQRAAMEGEARRLWPGGAVRTVRDLSGRDRVVVVELGPGHRR